MNPRAARGFQHGGPATATTAATTRGRSTHVYYYTGGSPVLRRVLPGDAGRDGDPPAEGDGRDGTTRRQGSTPRAGSSTSSTPRTTSACSSCGRTRGSTCRRRSTEGRSSSYPYYSFGDNWNYAYYDLRRRLQHSTPTKIPQMTVSPDGRFAAMKLRTVLVRPVRAGGHDRHRGLQPDRGALLERGAGTPGQVINDGGGRTRRRTGSCCSPPA